MLLPLQNRRLAYDLMGPENGPVVCFTHSLASDGGMWAEQVPPLLAAGFRVLRVDMRGHGGSDAGAGDYTMEQLAGDTAAGGDARFRIVYSRPKLRTIKRRCGVGGGAGDRGPPPAGNKGPAELTPHGR